METRYKINDISEQEIEEARKDGLNIYDKFIPNIEKLPQSAREQIGPVFSRLWLREQRIIDEINSLPEDNLPNTTLPIGQNYTLTYASEGKDGGSSWGGDIITLGSTLMLEEIGSMLMRGF